MARKLTDSVVAQIQARKREGLTHQQLGDEFGVSVGSISTALRTKAPAPQHEPAVGDPLPPAATAESDPLPLAELRTVLSGIARTLNELASNARAKGDTGVYLQLARAATMAIKELGRFTPPPAPELEQQPDMKAAAARARAALHALIDRELASGS